MSIQIESEDIRRVLHQSIPPMVEALPPAFRPEREKRIYVCECVKVIVQIFSLYGFEITGYAVKPTRDHWESLLQFTSPLKLAKYKLAAFYAYWKQQELPPAPFPAHLDHPGVLLGGRAYRWLHLMSERDECKRRFGSLLASCLYSKKGMPRPSEDLLRQAEIDTVVKLTTKAPLGVPSLLDWADVSEDNHPDIPISLDRATVRGVLRRAVVELFAGQTYTREDRIHPFFPSTSANYINTRNLGGAVGVILADDSLMAGLRSDEELIKIESAGTGRVRRIIANDTLLRERFATLYDRIVEKAVSEKPRAVPKGLPEALKIRVISKGPPYLMTALKPLQKKMWKIVRSHPSCSLIGQPVTATYVQDRMGKNLRFGQYFLSADYTAATDELQSWVSEEVAEAISDELKLSDVERKLFLTSLTRHEMVHPEIPHEVEMQGMPFQAVALPVGIDPEDVGQEGDPTWQWDEEDGVWFKVQQNGQLMGSVTSFPVLCIANLAMCRWAKELDDNRIYTLRDCPLCVNGDDALLRITKPGRIYWDKITSFCGLRPSVGKVYLSQFFLNINSTTYDYVPFEPTRVVSLRLDKLGNTVECERDIVFRLVPYVNMGLLLGLKRSGGRETTESIGLQVGSLGSRARDLVNTCPPSLREKVLGSFIHSNQDLLRSVRVPWFLPEVLGGLGLPTAGRFKPSDRDLRLARVILNSNEKIPAKPVEAPWKVWQYVSQQHRFKTFEKLALSSLAEMQEWVGGASDEFESVSSIYGKGCVEALFRAKDISSLYGVTKVKDTYLAQLQAIWKRVWKTPVYPEPLNLDTIPRTLSFSGENRITTYTSFLESEIGTRMGNADLARLIATFTFTHSPATTRELRSNPYQIRASHGVGQ